MLSNTVLTTGALALGLLSSMATGVSAGPITSRDTRPFTAINHCSQTVYVQAWIHDNDLTIRPVAPGQSTTFQVQAYMDDMVVKASFDPNLQGVAQYEWSNNNNLYYDISLIDGNPFLAQGHYFAADGSAAGCQTPKISCAAGDANCSAYYHPGDPQTKVCTNEWQSLEVGLCSS